MLHNQHGQILNTSETSLVSREILVAVTDVNLETY